MVMRPANGSATVFQMNAAVGPSFASTWISSSDFAFLAFSGRSAGDGT
jgi:hypothetical protein